MAGLAKAYGCATVLEGIDLTIRPANSSASWGRTAPGNHSHSLPVDGTERFKGTVAIAGVPIAGLTPDRIVALGLGYAPQEQPLFGELSIRGNLRLAVPRDPQLGPALDRGPTSGFGRHRAGTAGGRRPHARQYAVDR